MSRTYSIQFCWQILTVKIIILTMIRFLDVTGILNPQYSPETTLSLHQFNTNLLKLTREVKTLLHASWSRTNWQNRRHYELSEPACRIQRSLKLRIARLLSSYSYMAFSHEVYAYDSERRGEELLFRDILKWVDYQLDGKKGRPSPPEKLTTFTEKRIRVSGRSQQSQVSELELLTFLSNITSRGGLPLGSKIR